MSIVGRYERIVIDRFRFMGFHGCQAWCALDILRLADGRTAVIGTEVKDNPGTSITNMCEHLASMVCREFGIEPERLVWIEHYGYPSAFKAGDPRPFDLATFDLVPGAAGMTFVTPMWRRMTDADWISMGLPPRQPVDYGESL